MTETSTTRTETNREIIRHAFEAWQQGTGAIADVFAPGMVWRIEGHSAASKEYGSKQQVHRRGPGPVRRPVRSG
jgi:ketosteroid isomerase-like protein